jgi:hypothetical protein
MTITFADGTRIEVAASALDDFVRYDLTWAEFVHGSASVKKPAVAENPTKTDNTDLQVIAIQASVICYYLSRI